MSTTPKKTSLSGLGLALFALSLILLWTSCTKPTPKEGQYVSLALANDVYNFCPIPQMELNSWFASGNVTVNGAVNAANSLAFPVKNTNCDFYKWSEQMFLWITGPSSNEDPTTVFDSATFYDVSPANARTAKTDSSYAWCA